MFSTGYHSSSGSYSRSLPWSGGVCLTLLRPTCKILQRLQLLPFNGMGILFVPFAYNSTRQPVDSQWSALPCGMDFRWHSDCSPGFILALKLLFSCARIASTFE